MALPPSTANWHWKNKNVTRWGTEWLEHELTTISVTGDNNEVVSISKVTEVDGDIELGQRKSKLITIFDCKVILDWSGKTSDGIEVKGTLTIPEVSHEIICDGLSEYAYNWRLITNASPEVNAVFTLARARLPAILEAKLATFPAAIIDTHGKDLTVSADPSRSGTPAPVATPVAAKPTTVASSSTSSAAKPKPQESTKLNTTTVVVEADFRASADDIFGLLTDEKRIPAWTRAPAQSQAQPGTEYALFGGGVKGKYISLKPGKEIVQTWALQSPTWPSGHAATLTTTFDQADESTKIIFSLVGVPLGMEEEIKRNIEGYYIHGFKSIGYAYLIPTAPVYSSSYLQQQSKFKAKNTIIDDIDDGLSKPKTSSSFSYVLAVIIATLVLAAAFAVPLLSSSSGISPPVFSPSSAK